MEYNKFLADSFESDSEAEDLDEDVATEEEEEGTSIATDNEDDKVISGMKNLAEPNKSEKGKHVSNQITAWENLLEIRIHLQKCLKAANEMPAVREDHGADFSKKVLLTKTSIREALDKLLLLQSLLLKQNPASQKVSEEHSLSDEEIPSDTEDDDDEEAALSETEVPLKKRRKLEDYEKIILEQHNGYKKYRNDVIQKWNDKTCIVMNKTVSTNSVLNQIEHNLLNKDKLIEKTQIKRCQNEETIDCEVFDDSDFYHQLLRELIEIKSADVTDPLQLGKQWIQLQSLRNKTKKKVDTKATKGRKIRYAVHNKLVNFMAPIEQNVWTENATNDLFNSLFEKTNSIK